MTRDMATQQLLCLVSSCDHALGGILQCIRTIDKHFEFCVPLQEKKVDGKMQREKFISASSCRSWSSAFLDNFICDVHHFNRIVLINCFLFLFLHQASIQCWVFTLLEFAYRIIINKVLSQKYAMHALSRSGLPQISAASGQLNHLSLLGRPKAKIPASMPMILHLARERPLDNHPPRKPMR